MMKLTTASLCILLSLVCGCKSSGGDCDPVQRKAELATTIAKEWSIGCRYSFEVDGPFRVVEVDEQLHTSFQKRLPQREQARQDFLKSRPDADKDYGLARTYEDTGQGKSWQELKAKRKKGDELYFFTSEEKSWGGFGGVRGYALIRSQEIVHMTWVLRSDGVMQMPAEQWEQIGRELAERERRKREFDPSYDPEMRGMGGWRKSSFGQFEGGLFILQDREDPNGTN